MKHVLVIDADKSLRDTYISALETAGYSVSGAASAQVAIGKCEENKPDVIVLELQLKGHSGVEFLQELRSYPEWQVIPIVLHSVVPRQSLAGFDEAFRTYGIAAYAYKPETSLKKLIELVGDTASARV